MAQLKEVILEYIREEYLDEDDDAQVGFDTPLISSGIVDSFSMVSLKRFLEREYSIQIPDGKATPDAFDSVTRIVDLLNSLGIR